MSHCSHNNTIISIHVQGKPFSITVIQLYAPTNNAEEAEVKWFYEDLQDLLELTSKKDILFIIGDWNAKVGSHKALRVFCISPELVFSILGLRPGNFTHIDLFISLTLSSQSLNLLLNHMGCLLKNGDSEVIHMIWIIISGDEAQNIVGWSHNAIDFWEPQPWWNRSQGLSVAICNSLLWILSLLDFVWYTAILILPSWMSSGLKYIKTAIWCSKPWE